MDTDALKEVAKVWLTLLGVATGFATVFLAIIFLPALVVIIVGSVIFFLGLSAWMYNDEVERKQRRERMEGSTLE